MPDAMTSESMSQQESSVAANMKRMSLDGAGRSKGSHPLASAGTPAEKEMQVNHSAFVLYNCICICRMR